MDLGGNVWAITLWTLDRQPLLVAPGGVGGRLSEVGRTVEAHWIGLVHRGTALTAGEYVILPDRFRALLYLPEGWTPELAELVVRDFMSRLERDERGARTQLWETIFEITRLESAFELLCWRQRIRAGNGLERWDQSPRRFLGTVPRRSFRLAR